ncbi:hypothetical protein ACGC1H_000696 [Rhizoctonia solani]|uniref:Uncharacterized protein n=1 Tax=Rhizoctonia solani TaxID=456999 RepID=A0A8H3ANU8_9AGAM|nr:unnamed protein product [Rhizoctonia solani]
MRIITNHEDGEVEMHVVIVDSTGVILNEYMVTGSDDHHIKHCWIPVVEGQTFEIWWFGRGPNSYSKLDILATPCLDGSDVNCGVLLARERARDGWGWLDSHQVSADMARPFEFGRLELADDDEPPPDALVEDPNTIRVQLGWGWSRPQQLGHESDCHTFECPEITTSLGKQEALLAGNYASVTLGEPIASDILETQNFRRKLGIPSAEFVFHYGPADWLQAYGIDLNVPSNSGVNEGWN